jgi:hypothetical protein
MKGQNERPERKARTKGQNERLERKARTSLAKANCCSWIPKEVYKLYLPTEPRLTTVFCWLLQAVWIYKAS